MQLIETSKLTMGTREIADLLSKNHSDIKRSAKRLADAQVLTQPLAEYEFTHKGNTYTEYLLCKRDCFVLVAQNSPEFTAAIVDRWQELESQQFKIPQTYSEALQLCADQARQIELNAPKVAFVEKYVESTGNKTFRQVAKLLKINERQFRSFMVANKVQYLLNGSWVAYQNHVDAGRFWQGTGEKNGHVYTDCKFTPKGIQWISELWESAK